MMFKKPAGVLMFLLVILKVLGTAEADCSSYCSATSCECLVLGLTSVPQDLPTTITYLSLAYNQITNLSQSDFSHYRRLRNLNVNSNSISTINGQAFSYLSNLGTLYLSKNHLTSLRPDMFTGLGNLQTLYLYNDNISDIQAGTFNPMTQLRRLELYNNKLTHLRSDMFTGLGNLTTLDLSSNNLTTLRPDMFTGLGNLQHLYPHNNNISDIQAGTFNSTPQLRTLVLSNNKLTTLRSDMFSGLGNLWGLSLHNNEITDIPAGTFNPLPQLQLLYLNDNHIQTILSNFLVNLLQLRDLRLSGNNITMFPFEDLSRLSRLDLYNNQMTTLPSVAYDVLSSISTVNIDNNPWQCDCRMVDFRLKMNGSYSFENQITCLQPDNFYGQRLIYINPEGLICEEPTIARFRIIANIPLVQGESNNTIHLICEATGMPTPDITVILPSGVNVTVESGGEITVTATDAGLYVCIAVNLAGSTFSTLDLDLHIHVQTVSTVTASLVATTSNSPDSTTDQDSAQTNFSPLAPSFSLPVLFAAICGSIAGTLIIVAVVLTIWCKRNSKSPPKRPDFSVVFNNTNTTTTVITNGQDLTTQAQSTSLSSDASNPHLIQRPASSQFQPYEDVQPPPRDAVPSQTTRGQALPPPNRSNNEPPPVPPVPPPRTASATGYENIPEHAYQPLAVTRNQPDAFHHYQSLRRT